MDRVSTSATRRGIFGVIAVGAIAAPAITRAAVVEEADAELIEIGRRYMELETQIKAQTPALSALQARFEAMEPPMPEVLRVRPGDHGVSIRKPPEFHDWDSVRYFKERIPRWEAQGGIHLRPAIERGREILAGYEAWWALVAERRRLVWALQDHQSPQRRL